MHSAVYAFRSEIDHWLKTDGIGVETELGNGHEESAQNQEVEVQPGRAAGPTRSDSSLEVRPQKRMPGKIAKLTIFVAVVVLLLWFFVPRHPRPYAADVLYRNLLRVRDNEGRLLWSKQFSSDLRIATPRQRSAPIVRDLDGDGLNEVLVAIVTDPFDSRIKDKAICFNANGSIRWEFIPGDKVRWGGFEYPDQYCLWDVSAEGSMGSGRTFIVVVANHSPDFASQVSILDLNGKRIGEYWNTGYIFYHQVWDVDRDGVDEIVLGGINNLLKRPCVAIIKPDLTRSISPVPDGYAPSFATGKEVRYSVFPRTDVAEVLSADSRVRSITCSAGNLLEVGLEFVVPGTTEIMERVYYLDTSFNAVRLVVPQSFLNLHGRLKREGLLDHEFDESEKEKLMQLECIVPRQTRPISIPPVSSR